jgi:hypothetical protein
MNRRFLFLLLTVATIALSCGKINPCGKIECANGGECKHGTCYCPVGYDGDLCEQEVRQRYAGYYRGTLVKDNVLYPDFILTSSAESVMSTRLRFSQVYGDFLLNTYFQIPEQQYADGNTVCYVTAGQGFCDGEILQYEYTYTKDGVTYTGSYDGYKMM